MELAEANRLNAFWAEMRSTCYLVSQSNWVQEADVGALIKELDDILGRRILSYPPTLKKYGIDEKTPYQQKKLYLGILQNYTKNLDEAEMVKRMRFMKLMADKAASAHKNNWQWRIAQHAQEMQDKGWYPFFVTLTVDPRKYDAEQLWKEGRAFRRYIRSLAREVCKVIGHPPPHKKTKTYNYRPESDYITYAGVVEHGKSREHHHGHFMIWLRDIPSHWKQCPNKHRLPGYRTQRECLPLRRFWKYCIDTQKPALYYRTIGDIWQKNGHCTPIDKKTGRPIQIKSVAACGNYVMKYMQKDKKVWQHRMKATRNLGMNRIIQKIKSMPTETVKALTWRPKCSSHLHSVSLIHSVPIGLVRSIAKRVNFWNNLRQKQLDLSSVMKTNYGHFSRMQRSVLDGARPDRMPSQEFYDWVAKFLPDETGYCEKKLLEAHALLRGDYPRPRYSEPIHIAIGANNIGHS